MGQGSVGIELAVRSDSTLRKLGQTQRIGSTDRQETLREGDRPHKSDHRRVVVGPTKRDH